MSYLLNIWRIFCETSFFGQLDIIIITIVIILFFKKRYFQSKTKSYNKVYNRYESGFAERYLKSKIGLFIAEKKYNFGRCSKTGKGSCSSCSRNPHYHIGEFSLYGLRTLSKKFVIENICKHFK